MRSPLFTAFCLLCASTTLFAANEEEAPGYRTSYQPQILEVNQLSILPSKTRKGSFAYGETNALINTALPTKSNVENSILAGFRRVHLSLGSKIQQKSTLYGVIGINSQYTGEEQWNWLSSLIAQPDLVTSNIARKTRYIAALHGRYAATEQTGLHVGFYSEMGMRASFIHPLLGIDYTRGPWLFQIVYPIKAGISYQGIAKHVFSLMIRPFNTAVRVHKGLHDRPAVAHYTGSGGEFRWDFLPATRWNVWASVGQTIGGSLTIGDKNNNHRHDIHLHQAPYFNVGVTFSI